MVRWIASVALVFTVAAAPAQQAPSSDGSQIEVALANFKFVPSTITLHHGQRYVLHLVNQASGGHDFVAPDFFAAATINPADRAKIVKGEIELGGGDSVDIRLTAPTTPGSYKLRCSHFMHAAFGMKGAIVVD